MASHTVVPLHDFYINDCGLTYLQGLGLDVPAEAPAAGRYPSPHELISVATGLPGYRAEVQRSARSMDIQLDRADGEWTFLCTAGYESDDRPCQFYFQTGSIACARDVLRVLASLCGPFVLLENDERPEIIGAGEFERPEVN